MRSVKDIANRWVVILTSVFLANGCDPEQIDQAEREDANDVLAREGVQRGMVAPPFDESEVDADEMFGAGDALGAPAATPRMDLGGGWYLEPAGTSLFVKYAGLTVARFSVDWDRFLVFRNLNGAPPYFYFNQNGDYGVYNP